MSATVHITSQAQWRQILSTSTVVIADCPSLPTILLSPGVPYAY